MEDKQKAEQLLRKDREAEKKCDGIVKEWESKLAKERDPKKRKAIDVKYGAKLKKADKESSKTYKSFYDFIHGLFSKNEIDAAMKKSGDFMSKGFIKAIFPAKGKSTKGKPVKQTPKNKAKKTGTRKTTAKKK